MTKLTPKTGKGSNPNQHQDFDKVVKKTFSRVYATLIEKLLSINPKHNAVKLPASFSRTKEKRPDFAVKVSPKGEIPHIVHVEFQGRTDKNMDKRELGYYSDFYWEFGLEIRQYVIYMGRGEHKMITEIKHRNCTHNYEVITLNKLDAQIFLNSNNPHELILAILCKYERKDAPTIIKQILEKLQSFTQNERELYEYTTDLEILSGLRNLQSQTKKQIDKMPIIYDLTKDLRYKEGELKGELKGKLEGERIGELKKARIAIINMLKMNVFTIHQIADVLEVSLDFVQKVQAEWTKNPNLKA